MAGATTPTVLTVSGTPTEFLPMPTPWPSEPGCANYIYKQLDGNFVGWDPFYGKTLDTAATSCQPPQVTSWWLQTIDQTQGPLYTAIGPEFVCPEAYYAAQTAIYDTDIQQIYCCPSQYSFLYQVPKSWTFASQCVSTFQPGASFSFLSRVPPSGATVTPTSTTAASTITVWGIPVNGFRFLQSTTVLPGTTSSPLTTEKQASDTNTGAGTGAGTGTGTGTGTGAGSTPITSLGNTGGTKETKTDTSDATNSLILTSTYIQTSSTTQINASNVTDTSRSGSSSSSLSIGVIVGITLGAVAILLILLIAAWLLWRQRMKSRTGKTLPAEEVSQNDFSRGELSAEPAQSPQHLESYTDQYYQVFPGDFSRGELSASPAQTPQHLESHADQYYHYTQVSGTPSTDVETRELPASTRAYEMPTMK